MELWRSDEASVSTQPCHRVCCDPSCQGHFPSQGSWKILKYWSWSSESAEKEMKPCCKTASQGMMEFDLSKWMSAFLCTQVCSQCRLICGICNKRSWSPSQYETKKYKMLVQSWIVAVCVFAHTICHQDYGTAAMRAFTGIWMHSTQLEFEEKLSFSHWSRSEVQLHKVSPDGIIRPSDTRLSQSKPIISTTEVMRSLKCIQCDLMMWPQWLTVTVALL